MNVGSSHCEAKQKRADFKCSHNTSSNEDVQYNTIKQYARKVVWKVFNWPAFPFDGIDREIAVKHHLANDQSRKS